MRALNARLAHPLPASPMAQTDAPWTMSKLCAKPSGSQLMTRLISPCCHRVTALLRCRAVGAKPNAPSIAPNASASSLLAANSMNSTPLTGHARRHRSGNRRARARGNLIVHQLQRAITVDRNARRRTRAEPVVENLEAPIAIIADPVDRLGPVGQRKIALPRHVAEMAAPRQIIHIEHRRVGDLDEKQLCPHEYRRCWPMAPCATANGSCRE